MTDSRLKSLAATLAGLLILALATLAGFLAILLGLDPVSGLRSAIGGLFAVDSVQALWYVTRAAGIIAYLLLWLSTIWGLAVASKIFDPLLQRAFTYDMHQFISLLAMGFVALHVVVLVGDKYLPFSWAQVLVPFIAPYRPIWVGVGQIALYLTILVTVTFYIRRWIGQKTFRAIHLASFLSFGGSALHGLTAGTDSPLTTVQLMYALTTLSVVFMTVYWYLITRYRPAPAPRPVPETVQRSGF